ncbi:MAG TPA: potassium/proton antiporter [Xanthobacteraceae bacterium]|jgi:cell volume regulation protein A
MSAITLSNAFLLIGAALVVVGVFSSLIASRFGAPLLLVFLIIGMLAGEDGPGGIKFSDYQLTYTVGSGALAVILFDGGLRTRLASFRGTLYPAVMLATVGVMVTALIVGLAAWAMLGVGVLGGFLLGVIVSSTDAAAVFFLIRAHGLQLKRRLAATLEIESGTNDPVAVFLTVVIISLILTSGQTSGWHIALDLAREVIVGSVLGVAGGFALVWSLNRVTLPGGLHPLFVVATAVFIYALASIAGGSGFLAVYLAGLVVGNRPVRAFASITSFHDTVTWLCQLVMFILLGLLVTPSEVLPLLVPSLIIALVLIFVARPVAVWLCLLPFNFSASEKNFIAWVGLRGAVSIFLAAIPTLSKVPNADVYFNVAFVAVFVSLALQGWTVEFAARRLNVALPDAAPEVKRIEIDLPGQLDDELVGYPVVAGSPALSHGTVPTWARPLLIVRDGHILSPAEAGVLRVDDYGYFLAPPRRVARLDRLFAVAEGPADREVATAFPFNGDIRVGAIAEMYGLEIPATERGLSIADLFADRFDEDLRVGRRIDLGPAALFVREMDGDRVSLAGLEFATADDPVLPFPPVALRRLFAPPRWLARFIERRKARGQEGQGS